LEFDENLVKTSGRRMYDDGMLGYRIMDSAEIVVAEVMTRAGRCAGVDPIELARFSKVHLSERT
jgi:hypothetical protein